jgi:hypothetical protein
MGALGDPGGFVDYFDELIRRPSSGSGGRVTTPGAGLLTPDRGLVRRWRLARIATEARVFLSVAFLLGRGNRSSACTWRNVLSDSLRRSALAGARDWGGSFGLAGSGYWVLSVRFLRGEIFARAVADPLSPYILIYVS